MFAIEIALPLVLLVGVGTAAWAVRAAAQRDAALKRVPVRRPDQRR